MIVFYPLVNFPNYQGKIEPDRQHLAIARRGVSGGYDQCVGLIPEVDRYTRFRVYGTPTTTEHFLGQPEGNIYGAKLYLSRWVTPSRLSERST